MTDVDAPATDKAEEATEAFKDAASRPCRQSPADHRRPRRRQRNAHSS